MKATPGRSERKRGPAAKPDIAKRPAHPKVGGLVSASEIIAAGGVEAWAKKTGYDSQKIKLSGIIKLTDKQVAEALEAARH